MAVRVRKLLKKEAGHGAQHETLHNEENASKVGRLFACQQQRTWQAFVGELAVLWLVVVCVRVPFHLIKGPRGQTKTCQYRQDRLQRS